MKTQRAELLNQLSSHGWKVVETEDSSDWWADEFWLLESIWSPVGVHAWVTFLVDPSFDGQRRKGEAVWAVGASATKPASRMEIGVFALSLGHGWRSRLPEFFKHLAVLRTRT